MRSLIDELSVKGLLHAAQATGLDRLDAQLLLLSELGKSGNDRAWLIAHDSDCLSQEIAGRFQALVLRRLNDEPAAYLVGYKEFFGLDLLVDTRVLVPRPDTETLVNWSLAILQKPDMPQAPVVVEIIDLGTGSGAIALAIAQNLKLGGQPCRMVAVDASAAALAVALQNAQRLKLDVEFKQSNWLDDIQGKFHLIASNPPYIANNDPHLVALKHEPLEALTAGPDGLNDIRLIIHQAREHLHTGGWLLLEHGYDQAAAVRELLTAAGFTHVQSQQDLASIERCSGGCWIEKTNMPA